MGVNTMASIQEIFGDSAQVKVLEFLLQNLRDTMMISDVAKGAGVANSTTARVVEPLIQAGIVKETRIGKQIRIIRINEDDKKAKILLRFVQEIKSLESEKSR
jgi:DNA-binding MarR family transcriptional regulator